MQIQIFKSFRPTDQKLYDEILSVTQPVSEIYPEYNQWFRNVFLPGLKCGQRMCIVARDENKKLAGCALVKKTPEEQKICTLYIRPEFRRQGTGRTLMRETMQELDCLPLMTVSQKQIPQFTKLLKEFGFRLSSVRKRSEKTNELEFYFNDKKAELIQKGLIPVLRYRLQDLEHIH